MRRRRDFDVLRDTAEKAGKQLAKARKTGISGPLLQAAEKAATEAKAALDEAQARRAAIELGMQKLVLNFVDRCRDLQRLARDAQELRCEALKDFSENSQPSWSVPDAARLLAEVGLRVDGFLATVKETGDA